MVTLSTLALALSLPYLTLTLTPFHTIFPVRSFYRLSIRFDLIQCDTMRYDIRRALIAPVSRWTAKTHCSFSIPPEGNMHSHHNTPSPSHHNTFLHNPLTIFLHPLITFLHPLTILIHPLTILLHPLTILIHLLIAHPLIPTLTHAHTYPLNTYPLYLPYSVHTLHTYTPSNDTPSIHPPSLPPPLSIHPLYTPPPL